MRRVFLFFTLALAFLVPGLARAQSNTVIDTLAVRIWPEYDQPAVLVIYDIKVAPETILPVEMTFRLPKTASLQAVAREQDGNLVTIDYDKPVRDDYLSITLKINEHTNYRLEYYLPFSQMGAVRIFAFSWAGDYLVRRMTLSVQEPTGAKNMKITPNLGKAVPGPDGLMYYEGVFENVAAGQEFTLQASYDKNDNVLSASSAPVESSKPLNEAAGQSAPLTDYLPWFLGGLGVALVIAAAIWFTNGAGGRFQAAKPGRRKHTATKQKTNEDAIYCPQCGKRATEHDRFCRACGGKLRREE